MASPARGRPLKEYAAEAGCSVETLRRAIRRKELLATIEPLSRGPRYVVTSTDFAAFLAKRREGR